MKVHVLGSGAGGGFPQWNCNCPMCDGFRKGSIRASARTQSSITVSGDGENWLLFNASPDVLQQLRGFPALQPARALRDTAIRAIVLIDAQIDHTTGLYMLREHRQPHEIWCTGLVREDLTSGNPLFRVLEHYSGLNWHDVPLAGDGFEIPGIGDLRFTALPLISNAPPYSPHRDNPQPGDNIGVTITDTRSGRKLFYAPGLGRMEEHVWAAMQAADCVLVDGTLWTDDEMIRLGASKKTSRDMGHMPQSGADGMIEWLDKLPTATRKVLIHINNTNPILDEDSEQRAILRTHGIEVAFDGMELAL
ncbi:MAG: pyrroloquinoline quinone biosynthesis protein PqqB [Candidatus Methylophosphatis roskildensis]|uniref:Coenzyme PQQ synthesis protein B n=1 Tax=Candidatus Methylophosphatis roskildensis TaxID=2899263 RepID=A0A9D7HKC4_9PROT|nr:pyrroloquinoline quinone biosynthesis protein PqqB [Candidatus Methylophosphatis roskildensis]MBK7237693.1 pyrroloquinoline quinone biosynthesis protein PqqB [Sterolibacteriaceae bacterium]